VQVTTSNATLARGVEVSWNITSGNGTVSSLTTMTDANGETAVAFKAGTKAGTTTVSAKATGLDPVVFTISQSPDAVAAETIVSGEPTVATLGGGSVALSVMVVDEFGNAVSGQPVFWTVSGGSGTFDLPSSISGADGTAIVNFTPDGSAGQRTIQALTGAGITANIPLSVVGSS
ncbi:MAG: Ig-like domain-containing protein, partial [Gemmatimonadota bacterium]|nr:Ig-like domain-containing protein [Gemmatimonadota bacterium]